MKDYAGWIAYKNSTGTWSLMKPGDDPWQGESVLASEMDAPVKPTYEVRVRLSQESFDYFRDLGDPVTPIANAVRDAIQATDYTEVTD